jgi:hypothetical protein
MDLSEFMSYAHDWIETEWPTTIVRDRYRGAYSGGRWVAFPVYPEEVPDAIFDEDIPCIKYWKEQQEGHVPAGVGATPDEALARLREAVTRALEKQRQR